MNKYVAILRGINVSGKNIIKMDAFKSQIANLGFEHVKTYIQSGNIVFESDIADMKQLESKIEIMIECIYGFVVPVWVRAVANFEYIKNNNPFLANGNVDVSKLHVTFLSEIPDATLVDNLLQMDFGDDKFKISDNTLYLNCPNGYGRSKLTNNFFESKLKVKATTRNWKTVCKLVELGNS